MSKGGSFERKLCTDLSLWWTDGESDDVFWRTPGSGSRATSRRKQDKQSVAPGDICSTDPCSAAFDKVFICDAKKGYTGFKALSDKKLEKALKSDDPLGAIKRQIQSNRRKGIDTLDFLDRIKGTPLIDTFYIKTYKECVEHDRLIPIVIFERDRKRACVMISWESMSMLIKANERDCFDFEEYIQIRYKREESEGVPPYFDGYILNLIDFLDWLKPDTVKTISERRNDEP